MNTTVDTSPAPTMAVSTVGVLTVGVSAVGVSTVGVSKVRWAVEAIEGLFALPLPELLHHAFVRQV